MEHVTTSRVFELASWAVGRGEVKSVTDFLKKIGHTGANLHRLRSGGERFRIDQLEAAGRVYGADMNWIFGFSERMFRREESISYELQLAAIGRKLDDMLIKNRGKISTKKPVNTGVKAKKTVQKTVQK